MNNNQIEKHEAGELRANGIYVIEKQDRPNGTMEIHRVGKLRIRGEKEPRTISYGDYAKLLAFWSTQERLIKDRQHVMVILSDGSAVNTADITSLSYEDEQHFVPKIANIADEIRKLPMMDLLLEKDGAIIAINVTKRQADNIHGRNFFAAKCHYREKTDGTRDYITALDKIPLAMEYKESSEPGYAPELVQIYKYGIPQL